MTSSQTRRVVCTGVGMVSPLAVGAINSWQALVDSKSGLRQILPEHSYDGAKSKVAGYVPEEDLNGQLNRPEHSYMLKNSKQLSRATSFAMLAAHEALEDAKLLDRMGQLHEMFRLETGVSVGQGMVDFQDIHDNASQIIGPNRTPNGYRKMSPFFMTRALMNMSAGNISIRYKAQGPNHCVSTACATGAHSIGDAFSFIKSNKSNIMICGSTEASINSTAMAGFERLKALCTRYNDTPASSSRPFDKARAGFVMGEGAGVVILEELSHAKARGLSDVQIYAEILGYGTSSDAHHLTAPLPDGGGAKLSMKAALKEAGLTTSSVSCVNAHATSTPLGDDIEAYAIDVLYNSDGSNTDLNSKIHVSSAKGAIGHLLGAAGSVETIFAILACKHSIIPHTLNLSEPSFSGSSRLNLVRQNPFNWNQDKRVLLKNSFGFGGTNATLLIKNFIN